jgi:drug/metabolite transporter (DMT)-like permease
MAVELFGSTKLYDPLTSSKILGSLLIFVGVYLVSKKYVGKIT